MGPQFSFGPAMLISLFFLLIGTLVSWRLKSKFNMYSKIRSKNGKTGREVAEQMLRDNGIFDVRVVSVPGQLTDHYNPMQKTVNLSQDVYNGANAAAAAVASHECGHAVQHAEAYGPLKLRSTLVPIQNASGMILNIIMVLAVFGGAFLFAVFPVELFLWLIVLTYGVLALFSLVTLPVEFDASRRALLWMEKSGVSTEQELSYAKDALKWAALTYVVAALGAVTIVIYYASLLFGGRRGE